MGSQVPNLPASPIPVDLGLAVLPQPPLGLLGGSLWHPSSYQVRGVAWVMRSLKCPHRPEVRPCLWRGHKGDDEDTEARASETARPLCGQDPRKTQAC